MKKNNSASFIIRAVAAWLISFTAFSATAQMSCEDVFAPAPLETRFKITTPLKDLLMGEYPPNSAISKQTLALGKAINRAKMLEKKMAWVADFQLIAHIPENTEQLQYLGYSLMRSVLKSAKIEMPDDASVYVSVEPLSIKEIIEKVLAEEDIIMGSEKSLEKLEAKIELIAATVGSPSDRLVIQFSVSERTGTYADMFGSGMQVRSLVIINRHTGMAVEFNFFEQSLRTGW